MPDRPARLTAAEAHRRLGTEGLARLTARMRDDATRMRFVREQPTALDVEARFDPRTVRTPALELLAAALRETTTTADGRLVVSLPPQEGKSSLVRALCVWLLADDPDRRVVYASYAAALARSSGRAVRDMVRTHPDELGLTVDDSHADASDWQLAGRDGGIRAVGVGGALTGVPADVLVVDDPIRNQRDADSEAVRSALHDWWSSVARTRLAPGAPVVVVQTRWHEADLAGRLLEEGWPLLNIPALSDGDTPDALDREPGVWLESARRRTVADWEQTRRDVGERTFAALYQGRPAPLAGGIFEQEWIDRGRVASVDGVELVATTVAIDPADTGTGDGAGVLVGSRAADGQLYVRADLSGLLSQGEWARRALLAAVVWEADTILQESNLGMGRALRDGWSLIRRQAAALAETGATLNGHTGDDDYHAAQAAALLEQRGDHAAADTRALRELIPYVDEVLARPSSGPCHVKAVTPRQSKYVRAKAVTGLYETGRCHHVGTLARLEHQQVTWQDGQPSPNELDTLAHLLTHLDVARSPASVSRAPSAARVATTSVGGARRRSEQLPMVTAARGGARR